MHRNRPVPAMLPAGCLARMRGLYAGLRPSERRIADYILAHPGRAVHMSITALAAEARTSESTIVKFAQRLGYDGYQQLRIALAAEAGASGEPARLPVYGEIESGDSLDTIRKKLLDHDVRALVETMDLLDERTWEKAAEAIAGAPRLHFYGVGASGFVALDAQHKFARLGLNAWAYIDPHLQSAFAALLGPKDVAVGISHSGGTLDTLHALQAAAQAGATTIAITHAMDSPMAAMADMVFFTGGHECPFRSGAIVSRMAQLAIIDALFIAVTIRLGPKAADMLLRSREAVADKHLPSGRERRSGSAAEGSGRAGQAEQELRAQKQT